MGIPPSFRALEMNRGRKEEAENGRQTFKGRDGEEERKKGGVERKKARLMKGQSEFSW